MGKYTRAYMPNLFSRMGSDWNCLRLFVHPHILGALKWLSQNLAFSFIIGMFFGVFVIDVCHSAQLVARIKTFADENDMVIKYENIKHHIREVHLQRAQKYHFFTPFHSERSLGEILKDMKDTLESRQKNK